MTSSRTLPTALAVAVRASNLRALPPASLGGVLEGSQVLEIRAGSTVHREGDTARHLYLVLGGLMRVAVRTPDGRTLTVRYCRPGALIGAATLFVERLSFPATIQAVADSAVVALRHDVVRRLADRDPAIAAALLSETSERVLAFIAEMAGAFAPVRHRIGRHLLDLASERQAGAELVAAITQQELADAVGTVREVVVRELRSLRVAGIVATGRGGITILQPDRLIEWNEGS